MSGCCTGRNKVLSSTQYHIGIGNFLKEYYNMEKNTIEEVNDYPQTVEEYETRDTVAENVDVESPT